MPEDFSFFDRFGHKEQTGIGGRSRVMPLASLSPPSPPPPRRLPHQPSSSPVRHLAAAQDASPKRFSSPAEVPYHSAVHHHHLSPSPQHQRRAVDITEAETLLLLGLPTSAEGAASTFRTSTVLGSQPLEAKRRVVDFVEDDDGFLAEVDRLRQSGGNSLGDSNIYGTPFHVSAAREAQLRRRPTWDSCDDPPLRPDEPNDAMDVVGGHMGRIGDKLPNRALDGDVGRNRGFAGRGDKGGRGLGGGDDGTALRAERLRARERDGRRRLEPLATQEADDIQRQLQDLRRQDGIRSGGQKFVVSPGRGSGGGPLLSYSPEGARLLPLHHPGGPSSGVPLGSGIAVADRFPLHHKAMAAALGPCESTAALVPSTFSTAQPVHQPQPLGRVVVGSSHEGSSSPLSALVKEHYYHGSRPNQQGSHAPHHQSSTAETANLPGGMYSHAMPSVVSQILYPDRYEQAPLREVQQVIQAPPRRDAKRRQGAVSERSKPSRGRLAQVRNFR